MRRGFDGLSAQVQTILFKNPFSGQLFVFRGQRGDRLKISWWDGQAIGYALTRWTALTRYRDDGRIEIDNNAAERALRGVALGRKNYLFTGSDAGGERAALMYSLIETAKLDQINPYDYLVYVIERIADHPINRIDELLPWQVAEHLTSRFTTEQEAA